MSQSLILPIKSQADVKVKYRKHLLSSEVNQAQVRLQDKAEKRGKGRVNLTVGVQRPFSADRSHLASVKSRNWDEKKGGKGEDIGGCRNDEDGWMEEMT